MLPIRAFRLIALCGAAALLHPHNYASAFSSANLGSRSVVVSSSLTALEATSADKEDANAISSQVRNIAVASALCVSAFFGAPAVNAGEIGVEVEAPTFITGETVEVGCPAPQQSVFFFEHV
jgi:hypothetical protein